MTLDSLFAPNPPTSDIGVLVRTCSEQDCDIHSKRFSDITTPGLAATRGRLLPPRRFRQLSGALDSYLNAEDRVLMESDSPALFENRTEHARTRQLQQSVLDPQVSREAITELDRQSALLARTVLRFLDYQGDASTAESVRTLQVRIVAYRYPQYETKHLPKTDDIATRDFEVWDLNA